MNNLIIKFSFTVLLVLISVIPLLAQYQLNGDTQSIGNDCFELTPAKDGKQGSVWFSPMIDLNNSFDFTFDFNFGCSDGGADGMSFSLSNDNFALGGGGHGQGFLYLWESFNIEFDNLDNGSQFDPWYDHVAMFKHGKTSHADAHNVAGPVQTDPDNGNVEDCDYHEIRVTWDAFTQTISVYFECQLRLAYTGNIVGEVFGGNPNVYWGFTAATGARNNKQIACLKDIKIFEPLPDYTMCPGGNIQLNANDGTNYNWSPEESLSNPNIQNPLASPETSTTYFVTITDNCVDFIDTVHIEVSGDSVSFNFSDSTLCIGEELLLDAYTENATYEWTGGETTSSISPTSSGYYIVTVTLGNQCSANDAAQINFTSLPSELVTEYSTICPGEPILLDATFPGATYLWQDGSTDPTFLATTAGLYSVMIDHFCESKKLQIDIGYDPSCTDVFIPNAFSPNNDKANDYFTILGGSDIVIVKQFLVADRWGGIIFQRRNFQPNDNAFGWDGRYKGKQLPSGVYVYFAEITFRDGTTSIMRGDVTLLR